MVDQLLEIMILDPLLDFTKSYLYQEFKFASRDIRLKREGPDTNEPPLSSKGNTQDEPMALQVNHFAKSWAFKVRD